MRMTSAVSLCHDLILSSRAETQLRELDVTRLQWLRGREELRAAIRDKEKWNEGETFLALKGYGNFIRFAWRKFSPYCQCQHRQF